MSIIKENDFAKKDVVEQLQALTASQQAMMKVYAALGLKDKIEENANEIMHTANTGAGAELIPQNQLREDIMDLVPKYDNFLGELPGYHGEDMGISDQVSFIGDIGFFSGNAEQTTGAFALAQGTNKQITDKVTINQVPLKLTVDVSKRELNYAIGNLEEIIKNKVAKSFARTTESLIINADTEPGATGNVNSDDQAAATAYGAAYHHLLTDNGMRKVALAGSGQTVNMGTIDTTDFIDLMNILGDYAGEEAIFIANRRTYNKFLTLSAFLDASQRGDRSTISGKAIDNIFGSDIFIARDFNLTAADGKIDTLTPSNNTKGGLMYLWKWAVQWGYGQPLEIEVEKVAGAGVQIVATYEVGFTIVNKNAGQADASVALGFNATV